VCLRRDETVGTDDDPELAPSPLRGDRIRADPSVFADDLTGLLWNRSRGLGAADETPQLDDERECRPTRGPLSQMRVRGQPTPESG